MEKLDYSNYASWPQGLNVLGGYVKRIIENQNEIIDKLSQESKIKKLEDRIEKLEKNIVFINTGNSVKRVYENAEMGSGDRDFFMKEPTPQKEYVDLESPQSKRNISVGEIKDIIADGVKKGLTPQKECDCLLPNGLMSSACFNGGCKCKCHNPKKEQPKETDWGDILYTIKRYTHDRSESGYDDLMGVCGNPCYQCQKDKKMIAELKEKFSNLLSEKQQETREEIGREFKKWYSKLNTDEMEESTRDFVYRVLGIKI